MTTVKPRTEGRVMRALRSLGILPDRGLIEPPAVQDKDMTNHVKDVLFRKNPEQILKCLGEKENLLCAAKLLLNEDFIFSSGWAISFAAKHGLDIGLAVPYLEEMVSHDQRNARCYAVRALTHHYLGTGNCEKLKSRMRSSGDEFVTREIADAFLSEVGKGSEQATIVILEALSEQDKEIRTFAAYVLDNAPGCCTPESRAILKASILRFKLASPLLHIDALRFMDDALKAIELQK